MKIQKGIVKYKERDDYVCTYGITDDGRQYFFLDVEDNIKLANGNRIASTDLKEAIDPMIKAVKIGVIDNMGNEVVPFNNRAIKSINDDIILVEPATPLSDGVIEANNLKNSAEHAAQLVSTPALIKDKINHAMGDGGRFIFNDQFSEATICDINGNNLLNNEYYSFIGMTQDKLYFSKNSTDSDVFEYSLLPPEVQSDITPNSDTNDINVNNTAVGEEVVENAFTEVNSVNDSVEATSPLDSIPDNTSLDNAVSTDTVDGENIDAVSSENVVTTPPVVEENAFSTDNPVPPVVDNIPPVEENTPPVVDNTLPVSEEVPPVVDNVPAVEENIPPVVENNNAYLGTAVSIAPPIVDNTSVDNNVASVDALPSLGEGTTNVVNEDEHQNNDTIDNVVPDIAQPLESSEAVENTDTVVSSEESTEEVVEEKVEETNDVSVTEAEEETTTEIAKEEVEDKVVENSEEEAEDSSPIFDVNDDKKIKDIFNEEIENNSEEKKDEKGTKEEEPPKEEITEEEDFGVDISTSSKVKPSSRKVKIPYSPIIPDASEDDIYVSSDTQNSMLDDLIDDKSKGMNDFDKDIEDDMFKDHDMRSNYSLDDVEDISYRRGSVRDNVMADVAKSMSNLIRQNKQLKISISELEDKNSKLSVSRRNIADRAKELEQRTDVLSTKLHNEEVLRSKAVAKSDMLEARVIDLEKKLNRQERELETLRSQVSGRSELKELVQAAKLVLGDEDDSSYNNSSRYGRVA